MSVYDVILTDPPWKYYGAGDKWGAAKKHYPCLTEAEISAIVPPLSRKGVLFMWTTSAFLEVSLRIISNWGLAYRGVAFVWVKTNKAGQPLGATGVRPSITKPLTEFVLAASPVAKGRPLPLNDEAARQTIFAPRGRHSEKPIETYERIESMYPNASKLEMFARNTRTGWDAWGNEVNQP